MVSTYISLRRGAVIRPANVGRLCSRPLTRRVRTVCRTLAANYPDNNLGNKRNPLDEYLFILLSLRTHEKGTSAAYAGFKGRFPSWTDTDDATVEEIADAIKPGGLSWQKAGRIKRALELIRTEYGEVSLRMLKQLSEREVERQLVRLPGVGLKTAKCIMLFSLGFSVLPVDTHVTRLAKRLGWIECGMSTKPLHDRLAELVPPELRRGFHVHAVQHGRNICRGQYPKCNSCCLSGQCPKVGT